MLVIPCVLAHNLIRSFQLDTLATPKPRSRKSAYDFLFRSMRTLRSCSSPARVGSRIDGQAGIAPCPQRSD
jgi:hypothetical protein